MLVLYSTVLCRLVRVCLLRVCILWVLFCRDDLKDGRLVVRRLWDMGLVLLGMDGGIRSRIRDRIRSMYNAFMESEGMVSFSLELVM